MIQGASLIQKARLRSKSPVHIRTGGETHNCCLRVTGQEDHSPWEKRPQPCQGGKTQPPQTPLLVFFFKLCKMFIYYVHDSTNIY